jgi:hypothetical protein
VFAFCCAAAMNDKCVSMTKEDDPIGIIATDVAANGHLHEGNSLIGFYGP